MIFIFRNFFFIFFLQASLSQARVFDMTRETAGAYLTGTMGNVTVNQNLYQNESDATDYGNGVTTVTGGEFGFFRAGERATIKFGFEILIPKAIKGANADLASVTQYKVNSTGVIYAPKIGIDLNLKFGAHYRWILSGGAGVARLIQTNVYEDTVLAVGDHTVEYQGDALTWSVGTGVEYYIMDTTTIVVEAAYRSLNFSTIKYGKTVTTFTGDKTGGDPATDKFEANRTANFSGIIGAIGFRFYF